MPIEHIHAFVVHPRKGATAAAVKGTSVKLAGQMFDLLGNIYAKSEKECDVDITFTPAGGKQQNDCRDLISAYLANPSLTTGDAVAVRLELQTDARSGMGLLFLISGNEGREHKIVISRFPTDNAIYVEDNPGKLTVQFLERVFMKNKASYKAATYRDASLKSGFWNGRAIDKQHNPAGEFSNYWIYDFLASQLTVTAAAGTRRLASAIRAAVKKNGLAIKKEIVAAATLAPGLNGQRLTINDFAQRFGLSPDAKAALLRELKNERMAQEKFQFESIEFQNLVAFKSIDLSNGGTLTAPSSEFDDVFRQEPTDRGGRVRFITEGEVVNERLKSSA